MKKVFFSVILISLLSLIIAGCANQNTSNNSSNQVKSISVAELKKQLNDGIANNTLIVDLREPVLYNNEHIPGAILIPFADFEKQYTQLDKNKRIILVCHTGPMGDASGQFLKSKGYEQVLNLDGGMQAWDKKS
ncbi:Rhodanese-related sulfurtransferase [Desulfosporosinus acidiphilus SJ4]|uniref:Rhodanese-related sulfurtransferase n=1 Tax=Desulfosporosinus acidiphilus (strain DSM 22704 / JCM 16185 / SJ4) TaxID=646529 RepID=I4DAJ6_DESAJ|nr:rhodanese-like domain-containing protein [Desulfosporosinus acidiphilus]AFM42820.1 Rhodanese-related sulfurtransferase [Desulfosporosinus acidiphilus SJ4]